MYLACSLTWLKKKINVRLLFWVIKATLVNWSDRKNIFVSLIWVRSTRLFLLFEHFPCSSSEDSMKSLKRRTNIPDKVFKRIEKCSRCYNAYLLSQTSRRVPLAAAGFHLNQIVSWFLSQWLCCHEILPPSFYWMQTTRVQRYNFTV